MPVRRPNNAMTRAVRGALLARTANLPPATNFVSAPLKTPHFPLVGGFFSLTASAYHNEEGGQNNHPNPKTPQTHNPPQAPGAEPGVVTRGKRRFATLQDT